MRPQWAVNRAVRIAVALLWTHQDGSPAPLSDSLIATTVSCDSAAGHHGLFNSRYFRHLAVTAVSWAWWVDHSLIKLLPLNRKPPLEPHPKQAAPPIPASAGFFHVIGRLIWRPRHSVGRKCPECQRAARTGTRAVGSVKAALPVALPPDKCKRCCQATALRGEFAG
jgi:hypothetical protein